MDWSALPQEVVQAIEGVGTAVGAAVSPISGAIAAEKATAEAVEKLAEVAQSILAAHNTPAMQANVEAQRIQADRDRIAQESAQDDLETDRKNAS